MSLLSFIKCRLLQTGHDTQYDTFIALSIIFLLYKLSFYCVRNVRILFYYQKADLGIFYAFRCSVGLILFQNTLTVYPGDTHIICFTILHTLTVCLQNNPAAILLYSYTYCLLYPLLFKVFFLNVVYGYI